MGSSGIVRALLSQYHFAAGRLQNVNEHRTYHIRLGGFSEWEAHSSWEVEDMKRFCVICGGAFVTFLSGVVCCKACYLEHEEPVEPGLDDVGGDDARRK